MTFQALIATVNGAFLKRQYQPPFDYLLINQTDKKVSNTPNIFNYQQTGLAKSRNAALKHATADICLIADDDIVFLDRIDEIILTAFNDYPAADIITFQTKTPSGGLFKKYNNKQKWHNQRSIMGVISVEIAFRKKSIPADLRFDEGFGLGADFATGEENIFLLDALRLGLKILYLPIPIVIHPKNSSGVDFNNAGLIRAKGAVFYRMFGVNMYWIALLFAYKKSAFAAISYWQFYKKMCHGAFLYKDFLYLKNPK